MQYTSKNYRLALRAGLALSLISVIAGCSTFDSISEGRKVNYKAANKLPPLDIPPDLTSIPNDDRYAVPDGGTKSSVNASDVIGGQTNMLKTSDSSVLPKVTNVSLERSGNQRWLVVNKTPGELWPQLKDFWSQSGFILKVDTPEVGVMETDWAENRPVIQESGIRGLLSKAIASVSSNGLLDKYRTRLERVDGGTEIYISHRGLEEVYTSSNKDRTVWQARNTDPELEAEFLNRLMIKLGVAEEKAKNNILTASSTQQRAVIKSDAQGVKIAVIEPFDRAWRRVGLALDRVGFAVEDRDRSKGIYYVRYVDQNLDPYSKPDDGKGFMSSLFDRFKTNDPNSLKAQSKYRIVVTGLTQGSEITVLNKDGVVENPEVSKRVLSLLQDELR